VLLSDRVIVFIVDQMKDVNNNMAEMQLKIVEILQPEVQKLKNFMAFQAGLVNFMHHLDAFCLVIKTSRK